MAESEDEAEDLAVLDILDDPDVPTSVSDVDIDCDDVVEVDPEQSELKGDTDDD